MHHLINIELLKHPVNWILVLLMVMGCSLAIRYTLAAASAQSED